MRTSMWRTTAVVVGALTVGIPWVATGPTAEERAAPPEASVCVFYGICVGPPLPGR